MKKLRVLCNGCRRRVREGTEGVGYVRSHPEVLDGIDPCEECGAVLVVKRRRMLVGPPRLCWEQKTRWGRKVWSAPTEDA